MNTKRLPLALELTKPVLLAGDREMDLHSEFDPKTQLSSNTRSNVTSASVTSRGVLSDIAADVGIDDVIA